MSECRCHQPPFSYRDYDETILDEQSALGELTVQRCRHCGQLWLKLLIEEPHHTRSGRWWRVPVAAEPLVPTTAKAAREWIENSEWSFVGGSAVEGAIRKITKPIRVI